MLYKHIHTHTRTNIHHTHTHIKKLGFIRKVGVGILPRNSLKCETHLCFQAKSFENYQLTFVSGG